MAAISARLRSRVYTRARGRCEYCQTRKIVVVSMHIDHIVPRSAGGATEPENLCLSCVICNMSKGNIQSGIDPVSGLETPLFNPRHQTWHHHFHWSDDNSRIIGVTATGRATVNRLNMNRADVVESRREWVSAGLHPP